MSLLQVNDSACSGRKFRFETPAIAVLLSKQRPLASAVVLCQFYPCQKKRSSHNRL
jgi:hypothetical protein